MDSESVSLLNTILQNSDSILMVFFVLIIIGLIPIYTVIIKGKKASNQYENERLKQYMDREKHIIDVVTGNTEVLASLRVALDKDNKDIINSIMRVHDRIDAQNTLFAAQSEILTRMSAMLDESIRNQGVIRNDLKETLITVNRSIEKKTKPHTKHGMITEEQEENTE